MERLTDKYEDYIKSIPEEYRGKRKSYPFNSGIVLEKLGAYEDLEEQGLLLRLPCRKGEIVYKIINQRDNYDDIPYKIVSCVNFDYSMIDEIGKTVFLNREQAEQALKEMGE